MDQVTQQNAALVEQAAAAADAMQHQSTSLEQLVSVFKISQEQGLMVTAPSRVMPAPKQAVPAERSQRLAGREAATPAKRKHPVQDKLAMAGDWKEF